jgi:hypothetical protein
VLGNPRGVCSCRPNESCLKGVAVGDSLESPEVLSIEDGERERAGESGVCLSLGEDPLGEDRSRADWRGLVALEPLREDLRLRLFARLGRVEPVNSDEADPGEERLGIPLSEERSRRFCKKDEVKTDGDCKPPGLSCWAAIDDRPSKNF